MLTKLRPFYEKFSIPLGMISLKLGLSPDFWTIFGLLASIGSGVYIYFGNFWLGVLLILVMNIADMLDGSTARAGNLGTPFGTVFDHVVDRYAEFFIFAGFMGGQWISPLVGIFTASGVIMASYVRGKAESAGGVNNCAVGLAGRQEKIILLIICLVVMGLGNILIGKLIFLLIGVVSHITAIQRLLFARSEILQIKRVS